MKQSNKQTKRQWPWGTIIFAGVVALIVAVTNPQWFWWWVMASIGISMMAQYLDAMEERRLKAIREIIYDEFCRDDDFKTIRGTIRTTIQEEMRNEHWGIREIIQKELRS